MELKLGNFKVTDVGFGSKTAYSDGVLTINKQEVMSLIMSDKRITKCEIVIVKPGEKVRLLPVKAAVEPRCKISGGKHAYPAGINPVEMAGSGVTHCMKGMSVIAVGKYAGFFGGIIDMSGDGAEHCHYSKYINVCLVMESTDEEQEKAKTSKKSISYRAASVKFAEYLGETVRNLTPDEYETYNFDPILKRNVDNKLPNVIYSFHMISAGLEDDQNTTIYGWNSNKMLPILINPLEILDGAISPAPMTVSAGGQNHKDFVNNPIIKRLLKEHGKTINFVGAVLTPTCPEFGDKERIAQMMVQLCKNLGVDGVLHNLFAYGHPQVDFMFVLSRLEEAGIKTVGLVFESSGKDGKSQPLIVLDKRADAVVTCGNISAMVELEAMDTVYGDLESLIRDPWSGAWARSDEYGPSLREDKSIIIENNCIWTACTSLGYSTKTVKEF